MVIAGLMSGSSLDGLDLAICDFNEGNGGISWHLKANTTVPFSQQLATKLKMAPSLSAKELVSLDHEFATYCAQAISDYAKEQALTIDYIASHGHTVFHEPQDGYTLQIGNGGVIAAISEIPTICDFRVNDIALGGQGAPIVPIVEHYLYPNITYFLNLGGIANISIHDSSIIAYDICPCNQILNRLALIEGMPYDNNGAMASNGKVHQGLLDRLKQIKYFEAPPPKSLDNTWVQTVFYDCIEDVGLAPADALATMTIFVAEQVAEAVDSYGIDTQKDVKLMITGGGAHNSFLLKCITERLPQDVSIMSVDPAIIDAKEAILMAVMGYLRVHEKANTITSVTGATRATCGGAIYMPLNANSKHKPILS